MRLRTQLRLLSIYSAAVTTALCAMAYFGFVDTVRGAGGATSFDRITVHRIDVVEPAGTPRLILSNRAEFPGSFFHGRELSRPDRREVAGMLYINDEGTEDGGLIYGGSSQNGAVNSFSHLSFDAYEQDQTISIGTSFIDGQKNTHIGLSDMPDWKLTPEVMTEFTRVKSMPHGPERAAAWAAMQKKYPYGKSRAALSRDPDGGVGLTLSDSEGHERLRLRVQANGTPVIQMLDERGHVKRDISIDSSGQ